MSGAAPLAVGLDLGTSGLKGVVLDAGTGAVAASAAARYRTWRPEPGAAEQEPADWIAAAGTVLGELAARSDPRRWCGIGLSAMIPTLVTLDRDRAAIGRAITWEDGRAAAEGAALRGATGAATGYRVTGQQVDGRYLLPMYLRLRRAEPERAAACRMIVGAKAYLLQALTGVLATDPSSATGFGCYDLDRGTWSPDLLDAAAGLAGDCLPELPEVLPSHIGFPMRAELAARWGLPPRLPVVLGAADSVLGLRGLGIRGPGAVGYLAGTSSVVIGVSERPLRDPAARYLVTPLAEPGSWGLEMDLLSTGSAVNWLAGLLGVEDLAAALAEAGSVPFAEAPVLLPYLAPGEQGALWDDSLAGTVLGLTLRHGRPHLLRALQSGIVLETRRCLGVLAEAAGAAGELWIGGGGSQSAALARDLADASGRIVHTGDEHDHSAIGAALLVLGADAPPPAAGGRTVRPDAGRADDWLAAAARHDAALRAASTFYTPARVEEDA